MSSNDVLKSIPEYLREIADIESFAYALYKEMADKTTREKRILADINLSTILSEGSKRWETILGGYDGGSRVSNKNEIIQKLNQDKTVTKESIEKYMELICGEDGYSVEFDAENNVLSVKAKVSSSKKQFTYNRIREYLPCNIFLEFELTK